MNKTFKGVEYEYHINRERGIIKLFSPLIDATVYLDDTLRHPATMYYRYNGITGHEDSTSFRECLDEIILEHFWNS